MYTTTTLWFERANELENMIEWDQKQIENIVMLNCTSKQCYTLCI